MGKDWNKILEPWMGTEFQGQYFSEFNPEDYKKILDISDYNLYFGKDEGSMGTIDAVQCGVQTIAPELGFLNGLVDYPFDTQEELNKIFDELSVNKVEHLTWERYCKEHIKIWKKLC